MSKGLAWEQVDENGGHRQAVQLKGGEGRGRKQEIRREGGQGSSRLKRSLDSLLRALGSYGRGLSKWEDRLFLGRSLRLPWRRA